MTQYTVDAFTGELFCGNPAAINILDRWPEKALMMKITRENNLSETAFAVPEGEDYTCVSRTFAPKLAVPEDPVCGSGHCHIVPDWAERLGREDILAFQASPRTGVLSCRRAGERVFLAGKAVLYAKAELFV